ncbi:MAG: signal recognition particle-docking protein FtsY [Pseudomonadota bacterium]
MSSETRKGGGIFGRMFGGKPTPSNQEPDDASIETEQVGASDVPPTSDDGPAESASPAPDAQPLTWYQRLTGGLSKTSGQLSGGITSIFTKRKLDAATLDDLEDILIQADLGVETATRISDTISAGRYDKGISPEEVREILAAEVARVLEPVAQPLTIDGDRKPHVVLVVGVNGAGKTTTIGKLAAQMKSDGRTVHIAAGDTFRAAAVDQLKVWGERVGVPVATRDVGSDPAGLAFDALATAQTESADVLLIDTAGRLQNKQALMDELDKMVRVIRKVDDTAPHSVLLVLDATTGQNAMSQVEVFGDRVGVTGLIMTKLDGTARGGILVAISAKHQIPIHAIGVGEAIEDLQPFSADEFGRALATQ